MSSCTSSIQQYCPVVASWSAWSLWGPCSSYCGPGNWTRTRDCVVTTPGADPMAPYSCVGDHDHTQDCFTAIHAGTL